ncbi:MAG: hypothetical protein WA812_12935, partial [Candidatus Cybelea sp.]
MADRSLLSPVLAISSPSTATKTAGTLRMRNRSRLGRRQPRATADGLPEHHHLTDCIEGHM